LSRKRHYEQDHDPESSHASIESMSAGKNPTQMRMIPTVWISALGTSVKAIGITQNSRTMANAQKKIIRARSAIRFGCTSPSGFGRKSLSDHR
jgi:hypothetical protein